MAINASVGARILIGPPAMATTAADYAALAWTEIGEVESIGEFGDQSASSSYVSMATGRVRKRKGGRDAGDLSLVVGSDPADDGQNALIAAEASSFSFPIQVVIPDATDTAPDSTMYFQAKVMGGRLSIGGSSDVTKRTFVLGIDTAIVAGVASTAAPPVNITAPTITGSTVQGQTLGGNDGTWSGTPAPSFGYIWQRSPGSTGPWTTISGATSSSYQLAAADAGDYVRRGVTATNSQGSAGPVFSPATGTVSVPLTITGTPPTTATVGSPYSFTPGTSGGSTGGGTSPLTISGTPTTSATVGSPYSFTPTAAGGV